MLLALAACGRSSAPPSCDRLPSIPLRRSDGPRVVAIGDLHGDLAATRAVLRLAGAIDDADHWVGGTLIVVQTGDILDRGDDEQAILDLLERLEREAEAAGGALIWLLGNHELMNAAGDFRYVTPGGFADFADAPGVDPARAPITLGPARPRAAAFFPGGSYARILSGQRVVVIVGGTVLSHAGVLPERAHDLYAINKAAHCWLAGAGEQPAVVDDQNGPAWTRAYGRDPVDCATLGQALDALGARRMVVGHTPQPAGISSACDGRLWRIDVGLAAHYGGPIQALLIEGNSVRVLEASRPSK